MFDRLLSHTLKSFTEICDFSDEQKKLSNDCVKRFETELKDYMNKAFALHSKKSVDAEEAIKQYIESTIKSYKEQNQIIITNGNKLLNIKNFSNYSLQILKVAKELNKNILIQIQNYFCQEFYQNILKTIDQELNMKLEKCEKMFKNYYNIFEDNDKLMNTIRQHEFEPISLLGSGAFGAVFEVEKLNQRFAIKIVNFTGNIFKIIILGFLKTLFFLLEDKPNKELETLSKSTSQFVVQIFDHWFDSEVLYLKMELCQENLKETLKYIPRFLNGI